MLRSALRSLLCAAGLLAAQPTLAGAEAPFLWELQGPKATHYLLGSFHLLPESASPLPPAFDRAYAASAGLVLETDIAALSEPDLQLRLLAAAKADKPLKTQIPAPLYERLVRRAAEVEMPVSVCDPFKPWFCAMSLELFAYQRDGFRPDLGIDQQMFDRAVADQKPVQWLEQPDAHLSLFTDMPATQSEQFLAATVDQLTEAGQSPETLLQLWKSGDAAGMEKLVRDLKARSPATYERLLAGRNRAWLTRLAPMLDADRAQLVVVGAAHLYGPDGLVSLLQQRGYRVQPVSEDAAPVTPEPQPAAGAPAAD